MTIALWIAIFVSLGLNLRTMYPPKRRPYRVTFTRDAMEQSFTWKMTRLEAWKLRWDVNHGRDRSNHVETRLQ